MKLLALHGHLQNAKRFKGQQSALTRHLKRMNVELIFVDAPYIIDPNPPDSPLRSWVQSGSVEESYKVIAAGKEANPEVVGIFAFSMGAMLALQLAAQASACEDSPFSWIKILVAISAPWPADDSPLIAGLPCHCEIPVLFVIGSTDKIAVPDSQKKFLDSFPNHVLFEHNGGHYVPSAKDVIVHYADFFAAHSDLL
jgi:pimeloyl-ACP methyl ester carboxylesterase